MLLAALCMSFITAGVVQAQSDLSAFTGKFTLTNQVLWGETVLQPGNYTITIPSFSGATFALVRDGKGRPVARFMSGMDDRKTSSRNALLIGEKRMDGSTCILCNSPPWEGCWSTTEPWRGKRLGKRVRPRRCR